MQQRGAVARAPRPARPGRPPWPGRPPRRSPRRRRAAPRPSPARSRARRPRSLQRPPPTCAASTSDAITPAVALLLRMPQDTERKPMARELDRLDHVVATDQPLATSPSPSSSTPWWWWDLTAIRSAAGRAWRRASPARAAPRGRRRRPGVWRWASLPTASGRCWTRVPPQRHVQDLHPPADAEQGHLALERPRAPGRARSGRARARCRSSPGAGRAVGRGIEVGAAGEDQRVEAVEQRVGRLGRGLVGRQQERQPARRLHRGRVGARQHGRPCPPRGPSAPARSPRRSRSRSRSLPPHAGSAALEHAPALVVGDDLVEQALLGAAVVEVVRVDRARRTPCGRTRSPPTGRPPRAASTGTARPRPPRRRCPSAPGPGRSRSRSRRGRRRAAPR